MTATRSVVASPAARNPALFLHTVQRTTRYCVPVDPRTGAGSTESPHHTGLHR